MSDPTRGDVNMRLLHALTDFAGLRIGRNLAITVAERALAEQEVDTHTGSDPHAWVSLEVLQAVADALAAETGAELITDAVTWVVPSRRDLSAMSLTALTTPRMFYANLDRARDFFARHVRFEVTLTARNRADVRLLYRAGLPRHAHSCQVARGVLHAVPLLFDLPPAELTEHRCFKDGADACEYSVRWKNERPVAWIGAAVGGAVLAAGMLVSPSAWWVTAPVVGWLVGRDILMSRLRRLMTRTTEEQRRVIADHEREFARRFDDLRGANELLESRVLERTSALERTLQQLREQNAYLRASMHEMEKLQTALLDAGSHKLLGEAVGELAHEIRNPLAAVSTNLQFLEEELPTDVGDLVDVTREMRMGLDRMRTVLGWFVSLYRSTPAHLGPRDLAAEVKNAVLPLLKTMPKAHVVLELEPARVAAHEGQLGQVAANLVTNAAQAMGESGAIMVRVGVRDGRAFLSVEDEGPGIPAELHQRVFERGFTSKSRGEHKGTGLGLYIARTIVERHAGRIAVRSAPQKGTIFEVDLPLLAEEREPISKRFTEPPSSSKPSSNPQSPKPS
jgi:signal transduction histidine kinase